MSARSAARARRTLACALSLVAVVTTAGAQEVQAPRFVRESPQAERDAAAPPALVPADSVARYHRTAHAQRRTGGALLVAGLATITASYVQFAHSGRMGMTGDQLATLAAGTTLGAVGVTRWAASRESLATAARWREARAAAQR